METLRFYTCVSYIVIKSKPFANLKPATQKDYLESKKRIARAFVKIVATDVQPKHVRKYMNLHGAESEVRANREKAFLNNVMAWGFERGKIDRNPCLGVKPFKEKARDRYVTDEEYNAVYDKAPPMIKAAMEIAYLCAARQGDILKLTKSDIRPTGLFIEQSKTGKKQIKRWTERLRAAVKLATDQPSKLDTICIIHTKQGYPYTSSGFKAVWKRCKHGFDFTFHDLKHKGISDFDGDKQHFSGHKTKSMAERYNRTADVVDIVDPEKKPKK